MVLFCEAQVDECDGHLAVSVQVEHHVVGFHVVVDASTPMDVLEDANHLDRQLQNLVGTLHSGHTFEMFQGSELILFHDVVAEMVWPSFIRSKVLKL